VRRALLSDARGRELVAHALRRAREGALPGDRGADDVVAPASPPHRGPRRVRVPAVRRGLFVAVAAAWVLVAVTGIAWYLCLPPFECPYIVALEQVAHAPRAGVEMLDGLERDRVAVPYGAPADRADAARLTVELPGGQGTAVLLLSRLRGYVPSPALLVDEPRYRLWCGRAHGETVVVFEDPFDRGLWCLIGTQEDSVLLAAARTERDRLVHAPRTPHPELSQDNITK